ncbi:hypothetical protein HDK77DRAFT_457565 [Phyllosticta capitalensis]
MLGSCKCFLLQTLFVMSGATITLARSAQGLGTKQPDQIAEHHQRPAVPTGDDCPTPRKDAKRGSFCTKHLVADGRTDSTRPTRLREAQVSRQLLRHNYNNSQSCLLATGLSAPKRPSRPAWRRAAALEPSSRSVQTYKSQNGHLVSRRRLSQACA